jgi:Amino acid permease
MTFTASRVKQEIAKEGILPGSLFFATGRTTPVAWLKAKFSRNHEITYASEDGVEIHRDPKEQSPMAALALHWCSSILLIAVTAGLTVGTAYDFLVQLYSYVIIIFVGFWVSTGLLYCKFVRKDWVAEFRPWGGPTAAIIYWIATLFVLVTAFLKPSATYKETYPWFLVPTIGISTLFWGMLWWVGLHLVMRWRGQQLKVTRKPYILQDEENGEWVMKYEIIRHVWKASIAGSDSDSDDDDEFKP